jgi:hypothetical protein
MKYCERKMKKFLKQDALLRLAVKGLIDLGHDEKSALEIVFNGYILNDFSMEEIYLKL